MPLFLTLLRAALAAGLAANGLAMLMAPHAWYHAVPGVPFTGPLNSHFVRDIGCAYLVAAAGLGWRAWRAEGAGAALAGAGFLFLHALVHLGETLAGLCGWGTFWRDVPGVVLPALLAATLAWPARPPSSSFTRRSLHA
jgi:hypothetical protein